MIKLSILILSLHERLHLLNDLLKEINNQKYGKSIQVLWLGDDMSMTVGEKRNKLLSIADGEYVCFIDDDDMIHGTYLESIYSALQSNPSVVTFYSQESNAGKPSRIWRFNQDVSVHVREPHEKINGLPVLNSPPNHLCVWKKSKIGWDFPEKNKGEDHSFAQKMYPYSMNAVHIYKVLYFYRYDRNVSRTQTR